MEVLFTLVSGTLIFCCLYLTLLLVKVVQEDQNKKPPKRTYPTAVPRRPKPRPKQPAYKQARVNSCLKNQLLEMVAGNQELATRLVAASRRKHPGRSEDWHWEKTIYDLERDRR